MTLRANTLYKGKDNCLSSGPLVETVIVCWLYCAGIYIYIYKYHRFRVRTKSAQVLNCCTP